MLQKVHEGLWVRHVPYSVYGMQIGRQIVVLELHGGGLWIHSPIPVTPELRHALAALGPVKHVMGPNIYHDECLEEFQQAYPTAVFHAAPGLAAAKRSVRFAGELSDRPRPDWAGQLEQHWIRGMPALNEVVFFHPASRSLIIADFGFNFGTDSQWLRRIFLKFDGILGRYGPSRFCRSMMNDKSAVRASVDRILQWDFDRIIVGHGRNIERGGREIFRDAFAFLP